MLMFNLDALKKYHEAQILGNSQRDAAIQKVREGIACFASLIDAVRDADAAIARYTRSDFPLAHFYEVVRAEALNLLLGVEFRQCQTCYHWRVDGCANRSSNSAVQMVFDKAAHGGTCGKYYYPRTPGL